MKKIGIARRSPRSCDRSRCKKWSTNKRERYFALAPLAIKALETVLKLAEDGRLARDVLVNIGVAPTAKERETFVSSDALLRRRALELSRRLEIQTPPKSPESDKAAATSSTATAPNDSPGTNSSADTAQNSGPKATV